MYLDTVIVASVVTIAAVLVVVACSGYYAYRHIVKDLKEHPGE